MQTKKFSYLLFAIPFLLLINCSASQQLDQTATVQTEYPNYEKHWESIADLEKKGLTRSILAELQSLLTIAEADKNYPQIFKIFAHQSKYFSKVKENELNLIFNKFEEKASQSEFPLKQIMHSALAEMYLWYYQQNRWRYSQRSESINFESHNIETWDLSKIFKKIEQHYDSSLLEKDNLQKIDIDSFEAILTDTSNSKYSIFEKELRPTLYDLLAHRALDFYISGEKNVLQPAQSPILQKKDFIPYREFVKKELDKENYSSENKSLKIIQDLLLFHQSTSNTKALVHVDLKRIYFLANNYFQADKDSLHLLALKALKSQLMQHSSVTEVNYHIASFYLSSAQELNEEKKAQSAELTKKAHSLCKKSLAEYPNSFGAKQCVALLSQIEQKQLSFESLHSYPSEEEILLQLEYKNLQKIYFKIVVSPFSILQAENFNIEEQIALLNKEHVLFSKEVNINDPKDFQLHRSELILPELQVGHYVFICSANENFEYSKSAFSFQHVWVSNISYLTKKSENTIQLHAFERTTGELLDKVKIEVWKQEYRPATSKYSFIKQESLWTDENGFASISTNESYRNLTFLLIKGNDSLISAENFNIYRIDPAEREKRKFSHIFLDRSIYRPGQMVYFKNILIESNGDQQELLKNFTSNVKLYNVNGKEVSSLQLTSNDFGSMSGSFSLPLNGLTGMYRIADQYGSRYFSVEEYKKPTFQVLLDTITQEYKLNKEIQISGQVLSYASSPISDAKIKYRVIRESRIPRPYFLSSYFPQAERKQIAAGELQANSSGQFSLSFIALPDYRFDSAMNPIFNYFIYVDATDINGETQSNTHQVAAAYNSFYFTLNIGDKMSSDSLRHVKIEAKNLSGQILAVEAQLIVQELISPSRILKPKLFKEVDQHSIDSVDFIKKFPHLPYGNEDQVENWEKGKVLVDKKFNTAHIEEELLKNKLGSGAYYLKIESKDKYGNKVVLEKYFVVHSTEKIFPAIIYISPVTSSVNPGDTAKILIGSQLKNALVIYEISQNGETLSKEIIRLNNEQKLIEIPILEKYRGGIAVHFTMVKFNRAFGFSENINVPFNNKKLDVQLSTFRDHLKPGEEDEWTVSIKDHKGEKVAAELLVSMYDASLDQFTPHQWELHLYSERKGSAPWKADRSFSVLESNTYAPHWHNQITVPQHEIRHLNWFGFHLGYSQLYYRGGKVEMMASDTKTEVSMQKNEAVEDADDADFADYEESPKTPAKQIQIRRNFDETAFFYPHVKINKNGDYQFSFRMPDALTEWKFMALAHTKDLKIGQDIQKIVSKKNLMLFPNMPRFFRVGDVLSLSTRISNMSSETINGKVKIQFFDAFNAKEIEILKNKNSEQSFSVSKAGNTSVKWDIKIPEGIQAITYRIIAQTTNFSDGEENTIAVLSNRMLVTESMPMTVRSDQNKKFVFEKLANASKSNTLESHRLILEFTSNPTWYAVQALPYLMESDHDNSEKLFSRYFANSLASHIANSNPEIKRIFDYWKNIQPTALLSNLEKNQELKSILIEETPWLRDAENETERKKRLGLLFDLNKMASEKEYILEKLSSLQLSNGGWPWFADGPDDRLITQHIVAGFGHMEKLGVELSSSTAINSLLEQAIYYLDNKINEDYQKLKKNNINMDSIKHIDDLQLHYLYTRSFFEHIPLKKQNLEAFNHFQKQSANNWIERSLYSKAMLALISHRRGNENFTQTIIASLIENSIQNEELGMYWKSNISSYYWNQSAIQTQALLIELFEEIGKRKKFVDEMKIWLLKQKQTQNWKSSKATVLACYALLLSSESLLSAEADLKIKIGEEKINISKTPDLEPEAGTGYIKKVWKKDQITDNMAHVEITKRSEGIAWGAVYWQYFEDLDKITSSKTPLSLKKQLFIEEITAKGKVINPISSTNQVKIGDKVIVRIVLEVDRRMEYLHMKDLRAAGLEAINVRSSHQFQDGLAYYQSTKDASTNFFFSNLNKGTYVFEYALRASVAGTFSNGITSIQCMYAPEFTSHSKGESLNIIDP